MIIWLASFPRSGNTLFRIALHHMGLGPTYSVHDDLALKRLSLDEEVGHADLPEGGLRILGQEKKIHFVKTHNLPGDDDFPAVYIVRDGRDAIASYAHYLRAIEKKNVSLSQLIARLITGDAGGFGLWSDHVRKWRNSKRQVITIKFDDLVADPVDVVRRALAAIGIPDQDINDEAEIPSFSDLQSRSSKFFRKGKKGGWSDDIGPKLERQFWRWNRIGMAVAGYEIPSLKLPIAAPSLPEVEPEEIVGNMEIFDPIPDEICMPPYHGPNANKDFPFLVSLAKSIQPDVIFEFGTASGNTVANLCKFTNAQVVTLNAVVENTSGNYRTYDLSREEIGSVYKKYGYQDRVQQIYIDSMNFIPEASTNTDFDLVIIDACHDFEYVINDFLSIFHLVNMDGYVLFHDCDESMHGHLAGCWRACTHLRKAGFNIKKVQSTWWALWSPADQVSKIDGDYLSLLDYEIEKTRDRLGYERDRLVYETAIEKELGILRSRLNVVRKLPLARFLLWRHRKNSS